MTARVTISLPDDLLERLDADAAERGVPRSELVQESLAAYLDQSAEERAAQVRRRKILDAVEGMRAFHVGRARRDGRSSLEILREVRETNDGAPLRDCRGVKGE